MEIIVKKSTDLSSKEYQQISNLFEEVFERKRTVSVFYRQYNENPFKYAWISLLIDDDKIVGLNSYIPSYYIVNGRKYIFCNSIDSMVAKPYRDFFNFYDMVTAAYKTMKANGVAFVYGYPNDNAYPVVIKAKLYKSIGEMYTYCLPYRIGGIKHGLSLFNPLSQSLSKLFVWLCGLISSDNPNEYIIKKDIDSYDLTRYNRGDSKYSVTILKNGVTLHYKIIEHEGVRTAFIIDLSEKSSKSFNLAVKHILRYHKKEFDLILYPGYLNFINSSLIRLPRRFEPKSFHLTGKLLDESVASDDIWHIRNWDTNLSNYDLI